MSMPMPARSNRRYTVNRWLRSFQIFSLSLFVLAGASVFIAHAEKATHPELSQQEMLIACDACHQQETPDVYQEWYDSSHGMVMVKCYECHGTFETFRVTPTRDNCAVCHANMMDKCPDDKPCWQCHIPHKFTTK